MDQTFLNCKIQNSFVKYLASQLIVRAITTNNLSNQLYITGLL